VLADLSDYGPKMFEQMARRDQQGQHRAAAKHLADFGPPQIGMQVKGSPRNNGTFTCDAGRRARTGSS